MDNILPLSTIHYKLCIIKNKFLCLSRVEAISEIRESLFFFEWKSI
jgi:hypothetical protein